MRVDGFADGGTRISHHNRAKTAIMYKNKDKTPLRMRTDGFADGGTRISHHNRAKTAIVYITLRSMQKRRAYGSDGVKHIPRMTKPQLRAQFKRMKHDLKCNYRPNKRKRYVISYEASP